MRLRENSQVTTAFGEVGYLPVCASSMLALVPFPCRHSILMANVAQLCFLARIRCACKVIASGGLGRQDLWRFPRLTPWEMFLAISFTESLTFSESRER